jgi:transforming growth factor-beta-induced protein
MRRATYLFAVMATAFLTACGGGDDDELPATTTAAATTIDKVAQDRGFTALLAAAAKAELGSTLSDTNAQLTVLAPTDAAFNNLATTLGFANASAMVSALPAAALKNILTYHVLPGNKPASQLTAAAQSSQPTLYTFEGQPAPVTVSTAGGVKVGDAVLTNANVVATDVAASNGVIHAIDKVLVPPGVLNIVQMAQLNPELSSLVSAVTRANLQGTLTGAGPFTVFAPTNAAFAAAPSGLNTQQLSTVLTYHVLGSQVLASQIPFGTPVATAAGQAITFNAGTPPTITDTTSTLARITATNVRASNGVIHLVDKVLIPRL